MRPEGSCSFHAGCDTARAWTLVGHNVEVPDVCAGLTSPRALTSPRPHRSPAGGQGHTGVGDTEPLLGTGPGLGGHLSALWRQQWLCQRWQGSTWDGWVWDGWQCDRTRGLGMLQGPPSSATGWAGLGSGQDTGSGGCCDGARGHTRQCTGRMASFLARPGSWRRPGHYRAQEETRTLKGTAAPPCQGMHLGPVRVPGRGHRALGTHRGQPPAQPTPARAQRSRGRVSLRAKGAAGRAGTRRAGAVPRSQEPRGARGDVPGARAAGCHPCAVRARAVPSAGSGLAAHTRVPTPRSGHTRTDTRGPSSSVPRHFPTPGWTQRPCSPPAPCPDLCTNPPGGRGEAIKRESEAAPAPEPGAGEWGHPRRGSCWEGDGVGTPVPPPCPTSCALLSPQP